MKRSILTILALLIVSTTSWGRSIELDMRSSTLGFNYENSDSTVISGMGVEAGVLMQSSVKPLIHVGLNVSGKNLNENGTFDINMGGRLYDWREGGSSFTSIALGGKVRFSPVNRVGISAHIYFAPNVTTFGNGEGMTDFMVRADYQVIPQAFVYVGHRRIDVNLPSSKINIDNNVHIGIKLLF